MKTPRDQQEPDWKVLRELVSLCSRPLEKKPGYHISHVAAKRLEKIDALLSHTYGVESIFEWRDGSGGVDCLNYDPEDIIDVQYCNTGDTYGITILYWREKFWIGDWGSIVENLSKTNDV